MNLTVILSLSILILFAFSMAFIFSYSLIQLSLVINYIKSKKTIKEPIPTFESIPIVTIQLPVYNELYVIERLIDKVCQFDYPIEKLEIQLLDDSNDETVDIISERVNHYKGLGFDIHHIQREERIGYKAGALKYGTSISKGEFIAIFDSDFVPEKDFLMKTIPHFNNDKVGVVQSKWGFINAKYSYLTCLQAFGLNAHFSLEQVGRSYGDHFINFNGTAGVWRKTCIADAGGWESDTLTEDLDLSYRAQLNGWKFIYLEDVVSPSELPIEINALKAQQFRWTKGAAECTSKNLKRVLKSKNTTFSTKLHAVFHLMNSSVFIFIFLMSIISLPLIKIKPLYLEYNYILNLAGFFMISWLILAIFYWTSFKNNSKGNIFTFLVRFLGFLSISMGLSLHNAIAVTEGYMGKKSPFIRTPKFNINDNSDDWEANKYIVKKVTFLTYIEGLLLMYFVYTFTIAIAYQDYGIMPLLLFLIFGYGYVFINSVFHVKKATKRK
jgi:cellulose synthase/poly-beta-1,6-N-acetylglucosamine synthase-like glycosyltransferase